MIHTRSFARRIRRRSDVSGREREGWHREVKEGAEADIKSLEEEWRGERGERKWSRPTEVKEALVRFNKVTFQLSSGQSDLFRSFEGLREAAGVQYIQYTRTHTHIYTVYTVYIHIYIHMDTLLMCPCGVFMHYDRHD